MLYKIVVHLQSYRQDTVKVEKLSKEGLKRVVKMFTTGWNQQSIRYKNSEGLKVPYLERRVGQGE